MASNTSRLLSVPVDTAEKLDSLKLSYRICKRLFHTELHKLEVLVQSITNIRNSEWRVFHITDPDRAEEQIASEEQKVRDDIETQRVANPCLSNGYHPANNPTM